MSESGIPMVEGGCLCGAIRYRIEGPCRNIIVCHCENCRRSHGHTAAYTSVDKSDLEFLKQDSLQWYHDSSPDTLRGFCKTCGSSMFWDACDGSGKLSVAAGSLDDSGSLKTVGHIFMAEAGQYYEIDDGLPRFEYGSSGALESDGSG